MTVPNGWVESPVQGDPKKYYQAAIGNYTGTNGKTIRIIARTDTAGNFQLYEIIRPSAISPDLGGLGSPFFTYNQSGRGKRSGGLLTGNDFNKVWKSVKQKSFEINQAVGTEGEKEALKNSKGYNSFVQSQPDPPDNTPGQSGNNTGGQSGSGAPPSTPTPSSPAVFDTQQEYDEKYQTDKEYKSGFLHYPIDMNSSQDRIVIVQSKYERPDVLNESGGIDLNKIIAGGFSNERTFKRDLGTVVLPMPNDISETNVTAWGEDSLSSLAALVGGAALGGVSELASGNVPGTIDEIMNLIKAAGGPGAANDTIKQLLTLNAAAAVTQKFGININAEAFRSRITGTAINPNLELLFQGPKLRSFGFQFKMTPRSKEEAQNIRYILKFFKKGMAPKRSTTDASGSYFLGAPNVFKISFKSSKDSNNLKSIGEIKTCALQQCAINYTPDGFYAAFNDANVISQPISVVMQLAFTELTPIYNDNYDESDENSVGFKEISRNGGGV